jgi:uncharacterized membrane protein
MTTLILGLLAFIAVHLVPTRPAFRSTLKARLGANTYKLVFSVISFATFMLIVWGYGEARRLPVASNPQLWAPPSWGRHVAMALMLPAMICLVASNVPSRVRDIVQHPLLLATKLWALGHLFVRGDLASVILFGSLLAYAVYDRISVKKRAALGASVFGPLGDRKGQTMGDVVAMGGGIALYVAFLFGLHSWLIGVQILRS